MQLKLTAQLKPISELKSLEGFIGESVGRLNFKDNVHITSKMLNKSSIALTYNKEWKAFSDGEYEYSLDWLTNITVSDDKLKLSLEVNDLTLTVKSCIIDSSTDDVVYKKYKDKFSIVLGDYSDTYIAKDKLFIADYNDATYTFPSHKSLTKWIRRLIKCKGWNDDKCT